MAFSQAGGPSLKQEQPFLDAQFDIFEWHPKFQSCVTYFLDYAQYNDPVQALAAYLNIQLPFQKSHRPVLSSRSANSPSAAGGGFGNNTATASSTPQPTVGLGGGVYPHATLLPYIRRLVATGFDFPAVLHGFFGDDWVAGIGPLHDQERRNYLFAAKSDSWLRVKAAYDMGDDETVPFLRPLQNVSEKEILGAEVGWSEWLAMQDWMLGPRAPAVDPLGGRRNGNGNGMVKEAE
ncbi:hypothetical protein B0T25DRAFT_564915 [Lasiosphaeria hispida]|uniref:Ilp is an apoptosis inhibitor n=1 Tax=Lasiosphaeria hispida TaxID=260671 RepID=A0AAJ0HR62_9PEZI|nr:hypothetical protein B0T25DRAFT_564915 [Lasiosphaeria hispida]